MKDWKRASEIEELKEIVYHSPPLFLTVHNKGFRISIQIMTFLLVVASVLIWFEEDSIGISGLVVIIVSLISFYYSRGESVAVRAISLLPLFLYTFISLVLMVGEIGRSDTQFLFALFISIGTVLYVILNLDRIKGA